MRWYLPIVGVVVAWLPVASTAWGAVPSFSLTQGIDATHPTATSVIIHPGENFTVNLGLAANSVTWTNNPAAAYTGFNGFSVFLQSSASEFAATAESPGITTGADPLTFQSYGGAFPVALPTSGNSPDLGYLASDPSKNIASGNYNVASFVLSTSSGVLPGTYTVSTTSSGALFDAAGNEFDGIAPVSYTVDVTPNVSPEPATFCLLMFGGIPLLLCRRRKT